MPREARVRLKNATDADIVVNILSTTLETICRRLPRSTIDFPLNAESGEQQSLWLLDDTAGLVISHYLAPAYMAR